MEYVVLGLLIIQSMTLYDLNRAFRQGISQFYSASYGSLQIALKNLLEKELISGEELVERGRNKKVYSINQAGREAFFAWMQAEIPKSRLEVTALSKVYFLGLLPDAETRRHVVREIIAKVGMGKDALVQMDEQIHRTAIPAEYQHILKYQLKTLDYGISSHGFAVEWFEALLHELDDETGA